jgi:hypothetical protein
MGAQYQLLSSIKMAFACRIQCPDAISGLRPRDAMLMRATQTQDIGAPPTQKQCAIGLAHSHPAFNGEASIEDFRQASPTENWLDVTRFACSSRFRERTLW